MIYGRSHIIVGVIHTIPPDRNCNIVCAIVVLVLAAVVDDAEEDDDDIGAVVSDRINDARGGGLLLPSVVFVDADVAVVDVAGDGDNAVTDGVIIDMDLFFPLLVTSSSLPYHMRRAYVNTANFGTGRINE